MKNDQSMTHRLWPINYRLWFKQSEIYQISGKPIFVCQSISQLKRKVVELSTGDKKVEEWKFLPRDWKHCYVKKPIICKTFLFMEFFHRIENLRMNTGDILILNLVTRKKFWMWKEILTTQIKEKAAGRIDLVERFGRREDIPISIRFSQMIVENDRIVINYKINNVNGRMILGWFSNSNMILTVS